MEKGVLQPEIHALIEAKDYAAVKSALRDMEVHDLAELLGQLEGEDLAVVFRLLPQETAAEIFGDFDIERQETMLSTLSSEKVASLLNDMPPDDRTELLEELPGELAQRLLSQLRGEEQKIARTLLAYPEDSIGRLMTPEYVAVRPDWTLEQVLGHIRKVAATKETFNVLYVVDDHWKLLDELPLGNVVLAEPSRQVSELMDNQFAALHAADDREAAVEIFRKYDALVMPVVNSQNVLVGIVTVDDVLDVAEEEITEDFQKMTAVAALEGGYFQTSGAQMLRKRLPWLCLLLLVETVAVMVLSGYEKMLAMLAIFMPLINATAGNTGGQVAGLMIRGFAVQEVELRHWLRVLGRELGRGLTMGAVLAGVSLAIVLAFHSPLAVGLGVAIAMGVAVTLANVLGAMLPFVFKGLGVDPAVTSGPFIACLMDISSIVIYFSTATAIIGVLHS